MNERKIYAIPKGLDDMPEVIVVPMDIAGVWFVTFMSLFMANPFVALIVSLLVAWGYSHFKKGKPKNYIYLLGYRVGLFSKPGLPSPVVKTFRE